LRVAAAQEWHLGSEENAQLREGGFLAYVYWQIGRRTRPTSERASDHRGGKKQRKGNGRRNGRKEGKRGKEKEKEKEKEEKTGESKKGVWTEEMQNEGNQKDVKQERMNKSKKTEERTALKGKVYMRRNWSDWITNWMSEWRTMRKGGRYCTGS
jgi:hypothetical protein